MQGSEVVNLNKNLLDKASFIKATIQDIPDIIKNRTKEYALKENAVNKDFHYYVLEIYDEKDDALQSMIVCKETQQIVASLVFTTPYTITPELIELIEIYANKKNKKSNKPEDIEGIKCTSN